MILPLLAYFIASVHCQGGHSGGGHGFDLPTLAKGSFSLLDVSPTDGSLSESEWDALLVIYNANGDACTDFTEYQTHTGMPENIAKLVYNSLDTNLDGCLTSPEMATKFRSVDTNANGDINLVEYTAYYSAVFSQFSHTPVG